jgi:hypothetical protein
VIGTHKFNGFAPKDSFPVQRAAVEKHLSKAAVILRRAEEKTAFTAFKLGANRGGSGFLARHGNELSSLGTVNKGRPLKLLGAQKEKPYRYLFPGWKVRGTLPASFR